MSFGNPVLVLVIALLVVVLIGKLAGHYFSPEAKLERRRRRSNSRVVSKTSRPMVKLSAKTKKR